MAGSGKTSLASSVVDRFVHQASQQVSPAPLAYFYCSKNASECERSNPNEILRSIVRQLAVSDRAQRTIHRSIVTEYERREAEAKLDGFDIPRLTTQDCLKLMLDITGPDPATIILDALDELHFQDRYDLIDALLQIVRDSGSVVKVFVTSRDDNQILALLSNAPRVRISAEDNQADIKSFVHNQVSLVINGRRLLSGDVSSNLRADLTQALIDGAGEM